MPRCRCCRVSLEQAALRCGVLVTLPHLGHVGDSFSTSQAVVLDVRCRRRHRVSERFPVRDRGRARHRRELLRLRRRPGAPPPGNVRRATSSERARRAPSASRTAAEEDTMDLQTGGSACATSADCRPGLECETEIEHGVATPPARPTAAADRGPSTTSGVISIEASCGTFKRRSSRAPVRSSSRCARRAPARTARPAAPPAARRTTSLRLPRHLRGPHHRPRLAALYGPCPRWSGPS